MESVLIGSCTCSDHMKIELALCLRQPHAKFDNDDFNSLEKTPAKHESTHTPREDDSQTDSLFPGVLAAK